MVDVLGTEQTVANEKLSIDVQCEVGEQVRDIEERIIGRLGAERDAASKEPIVDAQREVGDSNYKVHQLLDITSRSLCDRFYRL